jgi:hypothetical protein
MLTTAETKWILERFIFWPGLFLLGTGVSRMLEISGFLDTDDTDFDRLAERFSKHNQTKGILTL